MGDWIKLHRCLLDSAVFQDDWLCRLFVWCLLKANFAPRVNRKTLPLAAARERAAGERGLSFRHWKKFRNTAARGRTAWTRSSSMISTRATAGKSERTR